MSSSSLPLHDRRCEIHPLHSPQVYQPHVSVWTTIGQCCMFFNKISLHVYGQMRIFSRPVLVFFEALVPRGGLSVRRLSTTCLFFNCLLLNFSTTSLFFNIGKASNVNFSPSISCARLCLRASSFWYPHHAHSCFGYSMASEVVELHRWKPHLHANVNFHCAH